MVKKKIESETKNRDDTDSKIRISLNARVDELRGKLNEHRKSRTETENLLFEHLKGLVETLKSKIQQEKRDREDTAVSYTHLTLPTIHLV